MTRLSLQAPRLSTVIAAVTIATLMWVGWQTGELIERMDTRAEIREQEIEDLKSEIREETHEASRAAVEQLDRIERELCGPGGCEP